MKNFINFDAFTLVECVIDRIVNNYSEAELLCNVLDEKEYSKEAKEICKIANRTKLRLYGEEFGPVYADEEFEANEPVEMTDLSEIRQFISEHYWDMLRLDDVEETLKAFIHEGGKIEINQLLEEFDFTGDESFQEVRDAFIRSAEVRVRVAMVYEGFVEKLMGDDAEEVQEAIRECRRETQ